MSTASADGEPATMTTIVGRSDGVVLVISGELDEASDKAVTAALAAFIAVVPPGEDIRLDLSDVTFFSSSGIRTLLRAAQALDGQHLKVERASPLVRRVLEITMLAEYFALGAAVTDGDGERPAK